MIKQFFRKEIIVLTAVIAAAIPGFVIAETVNAGELPVLPTDVVEARPGNTFVGIRGHYNCSDQQEAIDAINELRKEACDNHYINPNTGKPLKKSDYKPVEWSTELERRARIRACEATLVEGHSRMYDLSYFNENMDSDTRRQEMEKYVGNTEIEHVEYFSENLAGPGYSLTSGVGNWELFEKEAWINQVENSFTGHYTSMIDPDVKYVGLGAFELSDMGDIEFGGSCTCGLFSAQENVEHTEFLDDPGECIQTIEVRNSALSEPVLIYEDTIIYKKPSAIHLGWEVTESVGIVDGYMLGNVSYSSNSNRITIKENGAIISKKIGQCRAKVTCTMPDGESETFVMESTCIPKKTKIISLSAEKKAVKVKWNKMKGITGYEIECIDYCHPWRQTKLVNIDGADKTSYTFTGLDPSLDYSFCIRTYKKINGEIYYSEYPQIYKTKKPKS